MEETRLSSELGGHAGRDGSGVGTSLAHAGPCALTPGLLQRSHSVPVTRGPRLTTLRFSLLSLSCQNRSCHLRLPGLFLTLVLSPLGALPGGRARGRWEGGLKPDPLSWNPGMHLA